jgi:transcriptional regulator with XRE-family HTH domain
MNTFASRLAALIDGKGWTQTEAAQQLGVSQTLISRYLSGKRVPLPRTISHIADRLGIEPAELVSGKSAKDKSDHTFPANRQALDLTEPSPRAMKNLKRRWQRKHSDRATIRHLIEALFPEDASLILAWLEKPQHG